MSHMTCGPCLLLSVQRENAVKKLLDLLGPEDPKVARVKNCGYWRAIFGQNSVANGLYGRGRGRCVCLVFVVIKVQRCSCYHVLPSNKLTKILLKYLRLLHSLLCFHLKVCPRCFLCNNSIGHRKNSMRQNVDLVYML